MKQIKLLTFVLSFVIFCNISAQTNFYPVGQGVVSGNYINDIDKDNNGNIYIVGPFTELKNNDGTTVQVNNIARFYNGTYYKVAGGSSQMDKVTILPNGHVAFCGWQPGYQADGTEVPNSRFLFFYNPNTDEIYPVCIMSSPVTNMVVEDNYLIIVGYFYSVKDLAGNIIPNTRGIAKINLTNLQIESLTNCFMRIDDWETLGPRDVEPLGNGEYIVAGNMHGNTIDGFGNEIPNTGMVAKISMNHCSALSGGIQGSRIYGITKKNNDLIFFGQFYGAYDDNGNYIYETGNLVGFNFNTGYYKIGNGVYGIIQDVQYIDNYLYVGGSYGGVYDQTGQIIPNSQRLTVFSFAENKWYAVSNNPPNNTVFDIYFDNTENCIYIGGLFNDIDGIANTKYFAKMTDNLALPVELTTFTAAVNSSGVKLNWETATEVNNYGFAIERKSENTEWKKVAFVNGHGNSNSPKTYSYVDSKVLSGVYQYRLKQIDFDGKFEYSAVVEINLSVPQKFELNQNYPNPFNPSTNIKFSLPKASNVTLKVFNAIGEEVATLINKKLPAGNHVVNFNGSNLISGVYFYQLATDEKSVVKKMLLVK